VSVLLPVGKFLHYNTRPANNENYSLTLLLHLILGDTGIRNYGSDVGFVRSNTISSVGELRRKPRKLISVGLGESFSLKEQPSEHKDSMQSSMGIVFMAAQCFGLCPVQGITSLQAQDIK
jgi:Trehalose receptor.